jgi:serine/threonine-protein kinase PpkA
VVRIRGREQSVSACELLSFQGHTELQLGADSAEQAYQNLSIESVAQANSQITARAAKDALKQSLWSLQSGSFASSKQRFKGYEIIRKLGEGGMSDVFLAYSGTRKTEVALKVLRTAMYNDPEMMRRFIQEYAVLASINHPHIAKIYDQGFADEYAYIAMEYLSGGNFKTEIAKRPHHARVIELLRQITSALDTIHGLRLVYRDLKPDNLLFRDTGELVLVDFGIVKNIREETTSLVRTQHGGVVGTPYYISPEQAGGKDVTHRSDFYSLGVMMYELLTGTRPYRGDSLGELLSSHLHAPTPRLPREHAKFQPFLDRMMHKIPEERPANCTAVWRNLEMLAVHS